MGYQEMRILIAVPYGLETSGFVLFADRLQRYLLSINLHTVVAYNGLSSLPPSEYVVKFDQIETFFSWLITQGNNFDALIWGGFCLYDKDIIRQIRLSESLENTKVCWLWERPGESKVLSNINLIEQISNIASTSFIVFNEEHLKEVSSLCISPKQIHLLSTGVDTTQYHPIPKTGKPVLRDQLNWRSEIVYGLYIGRFTKRKRVDLLVRIWRDHVSAATSNSKLVLIGSGFGAKDSIENDLRIVLRECTNIEMLPYTEERLIYYQAADYFVLPGVMEGEPTVLVEGMACGLPAVASNIPGHNRLVIHGVTGFLFQTDNPSSLGEKLVDIICNHQLRIDMGTSARILAVKERGISIIANKIIEILKVT